MQVTCHLTVDEPFRLLRRYRCLPELAESISRPTRHRIDRLNDPYACQPSNDANEQFEHAAPCCELALNQNSIQLCYHARSVLPLRSHDQFSPRAK